MEIRLATEQDLPKLKETYRALVKEMERNGIMIWDEIYPSEFLGEDIANGALYLLEDGGALAGAFALCPTNGGEAAVVWQDPKARALYLDRLGVSPRFLRRGIGSRLLKEAMALAKAQNAEYLRLFVVEGNEPAMALYEKSGMRRAVGIFEEKIDDELTLREYGFESKL